MAKKDRILISVAVDLVLLFVLVFAFGFIIGGKPLLAYVLYTVACSSVLSTYTLQFAFGINKPKNSKSKKIMIVLTIIFAICMCFLYSSLNRLGADDVYKEYETEVEWIDARAIPFGSDVVFCNQDGELAKVKDYTIIGDAEMVPDEESILTIREYNGMFNYPKYVIVKINGKEII